MSKDTCTSSVSFSLDHTLLVSLDNVVAALLMRLFSSVSKREGARDCRAKVDEVIDNFQLVVRNYDGSKSIHVLAHDLCLLEVDSMVESLWRSLAE